MDRSTVRFAPITLFLESDAIPPVILIKKTEGDVLYDELEKGTKIVLHVDFDMVRIFLVLTFKFARKNIQEL